MGKKKYFMTVDTETCTLPFANQLCKNAEQKKNVAIAKPLVYDIGWVISDRLGTEITERNFLVQETFFVPSVFSTAYYQEKRPIYMEKLEAGEIQVATWNEIMEIFCADADKCDILTAYNAAFDFKRAIPFTERYIKHLYSNDYNEWEKKQFASAKKIAAGGNSGSNKEYLHPILKLRGRSYPVADLWAIACDRLININKYRNYCLEREYLTASAKFFITNAEVCFQYLANQHDFIEEHTALSDARIENVVRIMASKKGKIDPLLEAFPFRHLGTTFKYVEEKQPKYKPVVKDALWEYIIANDGISKAYDNNRYWKGILNTYENL